MPHSNDKMSRRAFLKGVGVITAAGATAAVTGCEPVAQQGAAGTGAAPTVIPVPLQYPEVPYTPTQLPPPGQLRVFTPHEARTVEALTARILPGTPDDPGAREAGVVFYIDGMLAFQEGFNEATYRSGPYVQTFDPANPAPEAVQWYAQQGLPLPQPSGGQSDSSGQSGGGPQGGMQTGQQENEENQPTPTPPHPQDNLPTPTPVAAANQGAQLAASATVAPAEQVPGDTTNDTAAAGQQVQTAPFQVTWLPFDQVERFGYQSILSPREVYRIGISSVDRYANSLFERDYIDLTEAQQDQIIGDMASGTATGFDRMLSAKAFFHNLRRHTSEGMFSDPVYGGNRNMAGWKLIGYPGAQRAYDTSEFQREGTDRQPQSIIMMHPFNHGQRVNDQVILPVSGSQHDHEQPPAPPAEELNP